MGYYDGSKMKLWDWAKHYTLADNFFHAAFGGSFLNHIWLVCACAPRYDNAPAGLVAKLDAQRRPGQQDADRSRPTAMPSTPCSRSSQPHSASITDPAKLLPPQDMPTIGDELSDKGIDWAWYSGGWNDAVAGHPDKTFQFHHQPFAYFTNYAEGTKARRRSPQGRSRSRKGHRRGSLPAVVFYKPIGTLERASGLCRDHVGRRPCRRAPRPTIEKSPVWKDTVIIVTYDENGGYWDHVAPPKVDRWGPGIRVPTIVISPFAKKGYVDHTVYDTTSILKLIEKRYRSCAARNSRS